MIFHICQNGLQRSGRREDCGRCAPNKRAAAENQLYIRQVMRVVELKATLQRMVEQFEGAAETQDDLDTLAEARRVLK